MRPTIAIRTRAAKDRFGTDNVPPRGTELMRAIWAGEDAGLPVWRVPTGPETYVTVPRLTVLASADRTVSPAESLIMRRIRETGRCEIDGDLLRLLAGRPPVRANVEWALVRASRTPQQAVMIGASMLGNPVLRRLASAVLRDICALSDAAVAENLGYAGTDAERQGRRDAADGRKLWGSIPAWPWWEASDGPLPRDWWQQDTIVQNWLLWQQAQGNGQQAQSAA